MNIAVAYTTVTNGPLTTDYCARFVATWMAYPPGYPCDLWVSCNGGPLNLEQSIIFVPLNATMFARKNTPGWDLDGYREAAQGPCAKYDAMLCLGESVHFHREGWLRRLASAWEAHGPGMYGPFASFNVRAHLNTTAFMAPPAVIRSYPMAVKNRADRYQFEHGEKSLWRRTAARGMPVRLVTWDGDWEPRLWRYPKNILWRGDQSNCLMRCNHLEGYEEASPLTKHQWACKADGPFR